MPPRSNWSAAGSLFALLLPLGVWPGPTAEAEAGADSATAGEYVIAFDLVPGDAGIEQAERTVAQAGGVVLDVNPQLGVALVRSPDDGFLTEVRASAGIRGAAYNHAVGAAHPGTPHRFAPERPTGARRRQSTATSAQGAAQDPLASLVAPTAPAAASEPLAERQWNMAMIGATADQAHRQATGAGVDVGIIDTGIDARHPDIAPNFDPVRSQNFATDRPELDGPCEVASCVDPPDVDGRGHGTHVAGTVAATRNSFGMAGVAPDARLVSLRAGQDSGYFFLYETVNALVAAADLGLDVVNMSFYTDPWLYNCTSREDYISGDVTDDELAQQRLTREVVGGALEYAHERGVTLVAAAGNEHTDLAAPERADPFVPSLTGEARARTVRKDCINLPSEGPHVISVGAVGPSGTKADYSNWGQPAVALVAPGGWIRDRVGTPDYQTPGNLVLSAYPQDAAIEQRLAEPTGVPVDSYSVRSCDPTGQVCGFYTYLQGTSMAAPHVVGVAALLIQRYGTGSPLTGYSLAPDRVAELLAQTATDHPCPAAGVEDYTDEGRAPDWNAACAGTAQANGLYGEGIVNAAAAVPPS
jgi:subtilisin family serine protease